VSVRTLDFDPVTGKTTRIIRQDGKTIIDITQDAEPIAEHNKIRCEHEKRDQWWYVGSIDLVTCLRWAQESNTRIWSSEWSDYVRKKLNLSENRIFNQNRIRL